MKSLFYLLIILSLISLKSFAQPGKLDNTFGNNGIVKTLIDSAASINSIAIRADGKIVAGGWSSNTHVPAYTLARYLPNGIIDSTFGESGLVITNIDSISEIVSVAIQSDGKIVAGGYAAHKMRSANNITYTLYTATVVRYNENGTLDTNFNHTGISELMIDSMSGIYAIAIQSDGKIVAGGYSTGLNPGNDTFTLMRILSNGSLDNSFGNHGITKINTGYNSSISSVAIQSDHKIVALGTTDYTYFTLARYDTSGAIDNTFGQYGIVKDSVSVCSGNSIQIQSDGKLLAAGTINLSSGLIRYLPSGSRDSSFGQYGIAQKPDSVFDGTVAQNTGFLSATIQQDNKLLIGGILNGRVGNVFEIVRYNPDGYLDSTFGSNGQVVTYIDSSAFLYSLKIGNNGKIIAGGFSSVVPFTYPYMMSNGGFALVQYLSGLNTGVIDLAIDNNSLYVYPNPMRENETLEYTLKAAESITLSLMDIQGKTIKTFVAEENQAAGYHTQMLSLPSDLSVGSYLINLSSPNGSVAIKVVKD